MEVEDLTAERVGRNDATFRAANEGIAAAAVELDVPSGVPFLCECADPVCRELVLLSLDEYEQIRANARWFLNVPGHEVAAGPYGRVVERHERHVVVEKLERAGEVAEELDPRA